MRRRGNERRITGAAPADPVLRAPKLAGSHRAAASARKQYLVDLAEKPVRQRKVIIPQASQAMLQCSGVVRYFGHVVERHAWCFVQLEQHQVGYGRLRSLDLRREDRFLSHVCVDEEIVVRQLGRRAVEARERERSRLERPQQRTLERDGRNRRQGSGHECAHAFPSVYPGLVVPCRSPFYDNPRAHSRWIKFK